MTEFLTKESDEFRTPNTLWTPLHEEFKFTIDVAATFENSKLPRYYSKTDNALTQDWSPERVWCNPPYSRGNVKAFFFKAMEETRKDCQLAVLLIPTYTERTWFKEYRHLFECRFIPGRIQFDGGKDSARGNHMLVIFRNKNWCWWGPG